jgi:hypothetical protein
MERPTSRTKSARTSASSTAASSAKRSAQIDAPRLLLERLFLAPAEHFIRRDTTEEIKRTIEGLKTLSDAGMEPTDDAIPTISERVGYPIQRKARPIPIDAEITAHSAAAPGGGGRPFFRREFYRG